MFGSEDLDGNQTPGKKVFYVLNNTIEYVKLQH